MKSFLGNHRMKSIKSPTDINFELNNFLCHYRNSPHMTTGVSFLLSGSQIFTKQDLIQPSVINIHENVLKDQYKQKKYFGG